MVYASAAISSKVYLHCLCKQKDTTNKIAITYDDGIDPITTPKILDLLDKYHAKATFFVIGEKANKHPEILKDIASRGHNVGNHSYYHKWSFPLQTTNKIVFELKKCNFAIETELGRKTTLFRPPFGVTNPMIGRAVRRLGLTPIGWSIRSLDTMKEPIEKVRARVLKSLQAGAVILLHDNIDGAELLTEDILKASAKKGLKSVTINELFDLQHK